MKIKKSKVSFKIFLILTFILIYTSTIFVLSATNADNYNSILVINKNSNQSIAPLFKSSEDNKDSLFYPGCTAESVLRVQNDLNENISVSKLGMDIVLTDKYGNDDVLTEENIRYKSFMNDMNITIRYKNIFTNLIEGTLYSGSFYDFVHNSSKTNLKVNKSESVDLVYTIKMLETNANQNDSSGIKADIVFNFNLEGKDVPTDNGGDNGNNNDSGSIVDVSDSHWAHDCIVTLLREQIIKGYEDGTIRPENNISREEVAAVLAKVVAYKNLNAKAVPQDYDNLYTDRISSWAVEYVNLTTYNNIFNGYPNKTFKGTKNISREEAAKVIAITFNKEFIDNYELTFIDKNDISDWSMPYIKALVKDEVINGYPDNTFRPQNEITRAEFFTIFCKQLGLHELKKDNK